ncbi:hypothetical protein HYPBUDRAFT_157271 [Hyphopichia burtonii NRRL Y-1933]|uniref:Sec39 domain-containing protein n=1 Tax=Hyphopichia burtonii NRRL Y-1933 TaxID=984485 RepID=A0A1E4RIX6_9ASCO|nr:hypothetical protein HYPBUDRAFT_157271 [Hyphopichia burtonii NRRL Y-1933]ODV67181.1 hypothetical protein HYPBUDRAFT_157271 [Hyphopichia burtonii NRRL Y-1933]
MNSSRSLEEGESGGFDAKIFLSAARLLTLNQKTASVGLKEAFDVIGNAVNHHSKLQFTNIRNILGLLLLYSSPASVPIEDIAFVCKRFVQASFGEANLALVGEDLEEVSNWLTDKANSSDDILLGSDDSELIISTARNLVVDIQFENQAYDFLLDSTASQEEILYRFTVSKTINLSNYFLDISRFNELFELSKGYPPFEKWYTGIVKPFTYYWSNYGSISGADSIRFNQFVRINSLSGKFDVLISPINEESSNEHLSVNKWMKNVILPLISHYESDFRPLLPWLFDENRFEAMLASQKYKLWYEAISSIIEFKQDGITSFPPGSYNEVIKYFLASCYYYAIFHEDSSNVSSIEMLKIYDYIRDTLNVLSLSLGPGKILSNVDFDPEKFGSDCSSLLVFIDKNHELSSLYQPNSDAVTTLQDTLETCEKLYSINKLTISQFLKLRYSRALDYSSKEKEITIIMHGLNETNYQQLLSSARLFSKAFIAIDPEHESQINRLIVERFLFFNLFDIVEEFYKEDEFKLTADTYFQLANKKFWDSFNQASNLNDKIGKLNLASKCVRLFDLLSSNPELSEENRGSIIKTKHLLKVINNIKNFKIVVERGKHFTPYQLITQFGLVDSKETDGKNSPINLITTILENNPKSYLAYEKLYKIFVDFLIFLDDSGSDISMTYLPKIKSACIESALIDTNFDFAYKNSIELLTHYSDKNGNELNSLWLTFYQVGKFISPEWFGDYDTSINNEKISILTKQREVLALALKLIKPNESSIDNSKLLLTQWENINQEIENWYASLQTRSQSNTHSTTRTDQVKENLGALTNDLISDATNTTNQASEKLSNLFVSGLGWAIGANPE